MPADGLTSVDTELYGRIAAGEQPTPADREALARLQAWGMVSDDEQPVVLPPVAAAWTLVEQGLAHLSQQIQLVAGLPRPVQEMAVQFNGSRFRAGSSGSEFLAERSEVNRRIGAILASAQFELLGAHPQGGRTREQMELGIPRDTAALARGVKYRTLYRDAVRDDAVTCEWASTMAPRGAHFRTLADPFERVIVVDRRIAIIENGAVIPDAPEGAAWIITDRAMVDFCWRAFDKEWRRATVWHGERRVRGLAAAGRLTGTHRAILRALAAGDTLEGIGRDLDMKKRSVQRQLDQIRLVWNLPNAPLQVLTYHWATSPENDDRAADLEQAA